jgi:hypothetical protein
MLGVYRTEAIKIVTARIDRATLQARAGAPMTLPTFAIDETNNSDSGVPILLQNTADDMGVRTPMTIHAFCEL